MFSPNTASVLLASTVLLGFTAASPVASLEANAQPLEKRDYVISPKVMIVDMVCCVASASFTASTDPSGAVRA